MSSGNIIFVRYAHKCGIEGVGTISVILNSRKYKHIHKVFHVPEMTKNLLLAQEFKKCGLSIHLANFYFLLKTKKETRLQILLRINGLFNP
jgi:hypothetical protein